MEALTIPENSTSLGSYAFADATSLKSINSDIDGTYNLPATITALGSYTFSNNTGLIRLNTSGNLVSIASYTLSGSSNLTSVNSEEIGTFIIPDTVTTIGQNAFYGVNNITKNPAAIYWYIKCCNR